MVCSALHSQSSAETRRGQSIPSHRAERHKMDSIFSAFLLLLGALAYSADAAACEFAFGNYYLQYGLKGRTIHFRMILTGITGTFHGWNAIGFGPGMYSGMDTIVIRIINGKVVVSDEYVRGYTSPYPDPQSDITVSSISYIDNNAVISFSRPQFTGDYQYDTQLTGCQAWKFAVGVNGISPNGELRHHRITPIGRTVCIEQCRI